MEVEMTTELLAAQANVDRTAQALYEAEQAVTPLAEREHLMSLRYEKAMTRRSLWFVGFDQTAKQTRRQDRELRKAIRKASNRMGRAIAAHDAARNVRRDAKRAHTAAVKALEELQAAQ